MAIAAVPAGAAAANGCVAGKPTAASYTWNFQGEANGIFKEIQSDAEQALYHADKLGSFADDLKLDWDTDATELDYLRSDINDMGAKLCRLQTIHRGVAPWQQHAIDQIATTARLMAYNAQNAIVFGNANREKLWLATYRSDLDNLDNEARSLAHTVGNAVEFASVSKEYRDLEHKLGD
jgi:hypothetical protein